MYNLIFQVLFNLLHHFVLQVVRFRSLEKPKEDEFSLEL